jgi:glycosyltransferase involved in cell wall biosynthesis
MSKPVSIVIPTLNEGTNLRKTIQSLQDTAFCDYEIIVVDNGSTDGSSDFIEAEINDPGIRLLRTERLGAARARNYGADAAIGAFLIFVDAHVLFPVNWVSDLTKNLDGCDVAIAAPVLSTWGNPAAKGYGFRWKNARLDIEWLLQQGSETYGVPMVGSGCMAIRRNIFHEIGGFDSGMITYGCEDSEICIRAWLLGYKVLLAPGIEVSHYFRSSHPYEVKWRDVIHNGLRAAFSHFSFERTEKVVSALSYLPGFQEAYDLVIESDVQERRNVLFERRKYDDNWFFLNFGINF